MLTEGLLDCTTGSLLSLPQLCRTLSPLSLTDKGSVILFLAVSCTVVVVTNHRDGTAVAKVVGIVWFPGAGQLGTRAL